MKKGWEEKASISNGLQVVGRSYTCRDRGDGIRRNGSGLHAKHSPVHDGLQREDKLWSKKEEVENGPDAWSDNITGQLIHREAGVSLETAGAISLIF